MSKITRNLNISSSSDVYKINDNKFSALRKFANDQLCKNKLILKSKSLLYYIAIISKKEL
jgi:hypothetical protein